MVCSLRRALGTWDSFSLLTELASNAPHLFVNLVDSRRLFLWQCGSWLILCSAVGFVHHVVFTGTGTGRPTGSCTTNKNNDDVGQQCLSL